MPAKVYYAHAMSLYNTPQETRDVDTLRMLGFTVLNPNQPKHQLGANREGMEYFKGLVLSCQLLAFRALPDGAISSGVVLEIAWAMETKTPVIELPSSILRRCLTIDQTREYLREIGQR